MDAPQLWCEARGSVMSRRLTALAVPAATAAALVAVAPPGSSAATRGALPAPPRCSAADYGRHAILHIPTPGLPGGHPLYVRYCGPAHAVVRLHGKALSIRGGSCGDTQGYESIGIGLHAFAPAPTARSLGFASSTAPAVSIQLPGVRYATAKALTNGKPIRTGTFVGRLHDGTPFSGSWTCG